VDTSAVSDCINQLVLTASLFNSLPNNAKRWVGHLLPMVVLSKAAMVAIGKKKAPIDPPQRWVAAQLFLIESVNLSCTL